MMSKKVSNQSIHKMSRISVSKNRTTQKEIFRNDVRKGVTYSYQQNSGTLEIRLIIESIIILNQSKL